MPFFGQGNLAASEWASETEVVKRKHEGNLLAIDGVEGVSIESDETGQEIIVVFTRDESVIPAIPNALEGVLVRAEVTGEFNAVVTQEGEIETPDTARPPRKANRTGTGKKRIAADPKTPAKQAAGSLGRVAGDEAEGPEAGETVKVRPVQR